MLSDKKRMVMGFGIIVAIIAGGYAGLVISTGFNAPFSVVMSQSMQHDTYAQLGIIDTGDIMVIKSPEKYGEITSYIDAVKEGEDDEKHYGDYGNVIIYDRNNGRNPVIHRAILWVDYDVSTGKWSAPSLEGYEGNWYCVYEGKRYTDYTDLKGTLYLEDITVSNKNVNVTFSKLQENSGFLTLGDNPTGNKEFDQTSGIINHPISLEDIRSIPVHEIPFFGSIKILLKNGGDNLEYVPNSIPSFLMIVILLFGIIMLFDSMFTLRNTKNMKDRINTKTGRRDEEE